MIPFSQLVCFLNQYLFKMEESKKIEDLLIDIKGLLGTTKKVMNVEDLAQYTGLSKSKIYKLTHLRLIPMGNNPEHSPKVFRQGKDRCLASGGTGPV